MNYITEINAFYKWLGANTIKSSAIVLWHALMSIASDASHGTEWQRQITPSLYMLQSRTGLSRDSIMRARDQLKKYGRIDWESRSGNSSAAYTIIPFVPHTATQSAAQTAPQESEQSLPVSRIAPQVAQRIAPHTATQSAAQTAPIYKQDIDKTRLNNNPIVPFDKFWHEYPRKVAKRNAQKAWAKLNPSEALYLEIIAGLKKARASPAWKKDNGQYIPHAATWLNGRRWEDELDLPRTEEADDFKFDFGTIL